MPSVPSTPNVPVKPSSRLLAYYVSILIVLGDKQNVGIGLDDVGELGSEVDVALRIAFCCSEGEPDFIAVAVMESLRPVE